MCANVAFTNAYNKGGNNNKAMTREEIINLIESRIKSEYKKHGDLDWAGIAARKIYSSLKQSGALGDTVIKTRLCDGVVENARLILKTE